MARKQQSMQVDADELDDGVDPVDLDTTPLHVSQAPPAPAPVSPIDLTGKPKLVLVIGLGQTGKTTVCRWIAERAVRREGVVLASVDPVNRELRHFFAETMQPPTREPGDISRWLAAFIASVTKDQRNALVDLGGGDTALPGLVAEAPDLLERVASAGVEVVAVNVVSPRPVDLTPYNDLARLGFTPPATAIVLNRTSVTVGVGHTAEFRSVTRHPTYLAAVERGAVPIWMPHLHTAAMIRDRQILFSHARDGIVSEGKRGLPLGPAQQSSTAGWMRTMETSFSPIDRWLP